MDQFSPVDESGTFESERGMVRSSTPPSLHYVNESGIPDELFMDELRENREIASIVEQWSQSLRSNRDRGVTDIFGRKRWNGLGHIFSDMSRAAFAVDHDDILSTLADVTEGLTFNRCRFEMNDDDQEDVWNQWAAEVDLDSRLREMFRELFKVSQVYVGLWWDRRTYTVRTKPDAEKLLEEAPSRGGNTKRRKRYDLFVPSSMTILDPTKVLPVGQLMFGRERFAYCAGRSEDMAFAEVMAGEVIDSTVLQLLDGKYTPTVDEIHLCQELGVDPDRLWLFRPGTVFRHSLTKAQYERFAAVRLKPIFEILDMKSALRSSDNSALVGSANFIIVIKKGSDKFPAKPAEIDNLKEQSRVVARLPVMVGDHRLSVEIVSPALDNTLTESRWQVLDSRLVFAALRSFQPIVQGGNSSGSGVSEMSRVVSQGLENRRHQMIRAFERHIFNRAMNVSEELDERPTLTFLPKHVSLDFRVDVMNAILKLRDRGDISRETTLDELDFDQDVEARRRAHERVAYDKVFQSGTPFTSPQQNPFGAQPQQPQPPQPQKDPGRPPGVREDEPRKRGGTE